MRKLFVCAAILFPSLALGADFDSYAKQALKDEYFLKGDCESYISEYPLIEQEAMKGIASSLLADEIITYMGGGNGLIDRFINELKDSAGFNGELINGKDRLKEMRSFHDTYMDEYYSPDALKVSSSYLQAIINGKDRNKEKNFVSYLYCEIGAVISSKGKFSRYHERYLNYVLARPEKTRIGHFEISVAQCEATEKVGTRNQFVEPKQWEGSRFFIVNASFKNMDTEARLPVEGSLYINYQGKDYEFDSVEPIMLEGYNVWFKQVNPLIAMKAKIVYRIPDEIEGEVFWEPGRNSEGKRLWCGNVKAAK